MPETAVAPLPAWETFFVIVGSAAAVLTGLVFVAITLVADSRMRRPSEALEQHLATFTGSTVVHLCAVLLICALLSAPWRSLTPPAWLLGACGVGGVVYALLTVRRLRRPFDNAYRPVWEDWLWYALAPLGVYAALVGTALLLPRSPTRALFGVGALLLLLLFGGLRNAWDVAAYTALQRVQRLQHEDDPYRGRRTHERAARREGATPHQSERREDAGERQ